MPTDEIRCDEHGVSEITRPLGTAPKSVTCLVCEAQATRVFSVALRSGSGHVALFVGGMDYVVEEAI